MIVAPAVLTSPTRKLTSRFRFGLVARRRTARTAVLTGLAAVLIAHLWLAVQVETRKPHWRDPEFFHRQRRAAALVHWEQSRGHAKPLAVILGGSRPQMGLSPEALNREFGSGSNDPHAYNGSQSGSLPIGLLLNFHRLLDAGVSPQFLLIEVLPPVLADPGPMEDRIPIGRLSSSDLARLRPYHENPEKARAAWLRQRYASWHSLRFPLMANWGLSEAFPAGAAGTQFLWMNMTFLGWGPFAPLEWTAAQRAAQLGVARKTYGWLLDDFHIRAVNDRLYRDLLAECRSRGIRAALFTMPESPAFRSWYPPGVRPRIRDYLQSLADESGSRYFDASDWIDDENAFMDGHHLIGEAAVTFSERFGRECVGPWVRGK